jgi:hypothetical protein
VRWPDEAKGPWTIRLWWADVDGRPECVGLGLWKGCQEGDDGEISRLGRLTPQRIDSSDLRSIPLAGLTADVRRRRAAEDQKRRRFDSGFAAHLRSKPASEQRPTQPLLLQFLEAAEADSHHFDQRVAGRYPDTYWAQVADVYTAAWSAGNDPTKAVAKLFKLPHSTAAKHVSRARQEGHLEPVSQGRAGGIPAKARPSRKSATKRSAR